MVTLGVDALLAPGVGPVVPVGVEAVARRGPLLRPRDVNEPGPSPQARKPAGTFPSPPGPQPAFFSPHLQIHHYFLLNIT